jgi:hypothetical protein
MGNNGGVAVTGNDSRVVRFATNVPELVATRFADGKLVEGRFGEQWMFSLIDGRTMYVPPVVPEQMTMLGIQAGEPFLITKKEVKEAGQRKAVIRWVVEKLPAEQTAAQVAQNPPTQTGGGGARQIPPAPKAAAGRTPEQIPPAPQATHSSGATPPPTKVPFDEAVVDAVRMVQAAMLATGEQWSDASRQGLVSTILIAAEKEGWVTLWKRGTK